MRQLALQPADHSRQIRLLGEAADGARQPHIDLRDAQFDISIGTLLRQVHIIHAHDLAAARIDDLLIEQILAHRQKRLVGFVKLEGALADVQPHRAGSKVGHLIVAGNEWLEAAAR